ncbi:MAG: hypothetical protein QMC78_02030 [Methanocellales archaeon]|nr:hypothetical protein [Methanocellales archaeon]
MAEIQPKTDEEIEHLKREFEEIKMERLKEQFREIKAERLRKKLEKTQKGKIREKPEGIGEVKKASIIINKIKSSFYVFMGAIFFTLGGFFLGSLNLFVFPSIITPMVLHSLSYLILALGALSLLMGVRGFTR